MGGFQGGNGVQGCMGRQHVLFCIARKGHGNM